MDSEVDWFLDTNMILHANVKRIVGRDARLFVTEKIASEVRKNTDNRGANDLLDQIESKERIVGDLFFGDWARNFQVLVKLCETLTPIARINIEHHGEIAWERAIQAAANEGTFFEPTVLSDEVRAAQDNGILSKGYIGLHKKLRKAWFSYHAKRAQKIGAGDYIFADEQLVAAAACNSVVEKRKTAILSNDRDLAVIIKNLRDNAVLAYSTVVCEEQDLDSVDQMRSIFQQCCDKMNEFEQTESLKQGLQIQPTEIPIFWENICHLNHYRSAPFFVDFLAQAFPRGFDPIPKLEKLIELPPNAV